MDDKELNYYAVEAAYLALDRTYHNYRPRVLDHAASMGVSTDVFGEMRGLKDVAIKYVEAAIEAARAVLRENGLAMRKEATEAAGNAGFNVLLAPENQRYSLGDGRRSATVVLAFLIIESKYKSMHRIV
jgi:predicted deacylase